MADVESSSYACDKPWHVVMCDKGIPAFVFDILAIRFDASQKKQILQRWKAAVYITLFNPSMPVSVHCTDLWFFICCRTQGIVRSWMY